MKVRQHNSYFIDEEMVRRRVASESLITIKWQWHNIRIILNSFSGLQNTNSKPIGCLRKQFRLSFPLFMNVKSPLLQRSVAYSFFFFLNYNSDSLKKWDSSGKLINLPFSSHYFTLNFKSYLKSQVCFGETAEMYLPEVCVSVCVCPQLEETVQKWNS